jgi:hypothetical protein
MSVGDMPSMASSAYGSDTTVFGLANNGLLPVFNPGGIVPVSNLRGVALAAAQNIPENVHLQNLKKELPIMTSRRLVQVFIADPDENVPLERSLLYSGEQKLTDATDQELFFEIDMKSMLEKHNETRVQWVNKKVKERTEYLEPAKIRDLKMVVVNVATF